MKVSPLFTSIALALLLPFTLAACSSPLSAESKAASTSSPPPAAIETAAPGDFKLESIIAGAEKHMATRVFDEIPAEEVKTLYPAVAALPVEVRGRRAADGTEYLVLASLSKRDIYTKDVKNTLEEAAKSRAEKLHMDYTVSAGGMNKYASFVLAESEPADLNGILIRTFTGEFLQN